MREGVRRCRPAGLPDLVTAMSLRCAAVLRGGGRGPSHGVPAERVDHATYSALTRPGWQPVWSVAQLVQALVVDAEVVRDLVDDRDPHLFDHVLLGLADLQRGLAVALD